MLFLKENFSYPDTALAYDIWGDIEVEFTVEKNSTAKNIYAVSKDKELKTEAECIVKLRSGK